jgi:hypothetical protein
MSHDFKLRLNYKIRFVEKRHKIIFDFEFLIFASLEILKTFFDWFVYI